MPWEQAALVGAAIGQTIAFEFPAHAGLSPTLKAGTLDPRTSAIPCLAPCGFTSLAPERRPARSPGSACGRSRAGTLPNLVGAAIAGLFIAG